MRVNNIDKKKRKKEDVAQCIRQKTPSPPLRLAITRISKPF